MFVILKRCQVLVLSSVLVHFEFLAYNNEIIVIYALRWSYIVVYNYSIYTYPELMSDLAAYNNAFIFTVASVSTGI